MEFNYLVIEGNIGAGKTTLARQIASEYNARLVLEQFDQNPFLPKFYEDPDRYAFPVELAFLADRYQQLKKQIANRDLFQEKTVADYYFVKSLIFSKNTLKDDEYNLYRRLFEIIQQQLPIPDMYVYLHVEVDNLLRHIKKRGRSYENRISRNYLETIQKGYFDFIKQRNDLTIIVLDANNLDFVNNPDHYNRITNALFSGPFKPGMNMVIP